MSQWNESRGLAFGAVTVAVFSLGVSVVALANGGETERDSRSAAASTSVSVEGTGNTARGAVAARRDDVASAAKVVSSANVATVGSAIAKGAVATDAVAKDAKDAKSVVLSSVSATGAASGAADTKSGVATNGLAVKRFVVTTGIQGREPLTSDGPLIADGAPVYAFAELANRASDEQRVSVTFERKGSTERVGHAALSVPANVPRHRTWANTRFIHEPGTWEAVLWDANGGELARAGFEVAKR